MMFPNFTFDVAAALFEKVAQTYYLAAPVKAFDEACELCNPDLLFDEV